MTNAEAKRRYFHVFVPAMLVFLASSFAIAWLQIGGAALYLAALVPIAALVSVFWAHWRLMREIDEFLRTIQMQAVLFGLAVILLIATGWGFLETYADTPRLGIFWLNPIFWLAYAAGAAIFSKRATGQFE